MCQIVDHRSRSVRPQEAVLDRVHEHLLLRLRQVVEHFIDGGVLGFEDFAGEGRVLLLGCRRGGGRDFYDLSRVSEEDIVSLQIVSIFVVAGEVDLERSALDFELLQVA